MQPFEPLASWNGEIIPLSQTKVPALDRGFLFGDGVYEVIRLYRGRAFLLDEHLERLKYSLEQLRIEQEVSLTQARLEKLLAQTPKEDGYAYIQITRGTAMRNHAFPKDCTPNELIYVAIAPDPFADFRQTGISVILTDDIRWHRPDIKSLNLLPNVLIRQQAVEAGCQEAILVRWDGRMTEATSSNVFVVKDKEVLTPKGDHWILHGISRQFVAKLCEETDIPLREAKILKEDLLNGDEVFLSSTFSEVIAVTCLDDRKIPAGPITRRLALSFRKAVEKWLQP